MLDPYKFHTEPEKLINYQENVLPVKWFALTREELSEALLDVNGGLEVMDDQGNANDVIRFISLDYKVNTTTAKIYRIDNNNEYVGHIDLEGDMIVFYDRNDEEYASIDSTSENVVSDHSILFEYLCHLFDLDPDDMY
jgi:hypothetical protein